ncbi:hypothetical protein ELI49_28290 (plasmid) [Rhizobium ruizarguesonis]|nr:hypothetical protein ELI49_28290 [Rhizobium ruizarguesonis]TAW67879.1 hypothetical protein ELI10_30270 [Rhizobium ruizarguesonis]TAX03871.1 hypothetical protein ELI09_30945 [Rhizobium ruizarguesonis]TAX06850.1 hypothetical protein ELI08_30265 [Rhizobium ruizarguesonis]
MQRAGGFVAARRCSAKHAAEQLMSGTSRSADRGSQAFLPASPAVVKIDIAETGTELYGAVDGRAIAESP